MPSPDDRDGHIGVRVTALETTRAVEQTALLAALLLGRFEREQGKRPVKPKKLAWLSLLGYLRLVGLGKMQLPFDQAIHTSDGHFIDELRPRGRSANSRGSSPGTTDTFVEFYQSCQEAFNMKDPYQERFDMEFVASPVDGVSAWHRGLAGALSVLAGGQPGSFKEPKEPWYLVMATAPDLANQQLREKLATALDRFGTQTVHATDVLERFFDVILEEVAEKDRHSFSTTTLLAVKKHDPLAIVASKRSRLRMSTGSAVAAALAAYTFAPTFDMFTAVVKGVQASLIAAAATATGGGFFTVPVVDPTDTPAESDPDKCQVRLPICDEEHFIKRDADVFLNATAVSHCPVLEGVRFYERDGSVVTQTLSLRSLTRSQRRLIHLHQEVDKKDVYLFDPTTRSSKKTCYAEVVEKEIPDVLRPS